MVCFVSRVRWGEVVLKLAFEVDKLDEAGTPYSTQLRACLAPGRDQCCAAALLSSTQGQPTINGNEGGSGQFEELVLPGRHEIRG